MFITRLPIIFALCLLVMNCSSSEKIDSSTAEGHFQLAQRFEEKERYDEAIAHYSDVKNKHPYSKFATAAELKIADIQFKREAWIEAQGAYQVFKELHPKHEKIAYVTHQLAASYFNQLPSTIDRDLSLADKVVLYADEVVNSYPTSEHVESAKEYRRKALRMLAEKELYIGHFYFIRKKYDSALSRYEDLLKVYPNSGLDADALYGAAVSALKLKETSRANILYERLTSLYPKSEQAVKARSEFAQ